MVVVSELTGWGESIRLIHDFVKMQLRYSYISIFNNISKKEILMRSSQEVMLNP